jgi:hypothetical protein
MVLEKQAATVCRQNRLASASSRSFSYRIKGSIAKCRPVNRALAPLEARCQYVNLRILMLVEACYLTASVR